MQVGQRGFASGDDARDIAAIGFDAAGHAEMGDHGVGGGIAEQRLIIALSIDIKPGNGMVLTIEAAGKGRILAADGRPDKIGQADIRSEHSIGRGILIHIFEGTVDEAGKPLQFAARGNLIHAVRLLRLAFLAGVGRFAVHGGVQPIRAELRFLFGEREIAGEQLIVNLRGLFIDASFAAFQVFRHALNQLEAGICDLHALIRDHDIGDVARRAREGARAFFGKRRVIGGNAVHFHDDAIGEIIELMAVQMRKGGKNGIARRIADEHGRDQQLTVALHREIKAAAARCTCGRARREQRSLFHIRNAEEFDISVFRFVGHGRFCGKLRRGRGKHLFPHLRARLRNINRNAVLRKVKRLDTQNSIRFTKNNIAVADTCLNRRLRQFHIKIKPGILRQNSGKAPNRNGAALYFELRRAFRDLPRIRFGRLNGIVHSGERRFDFLFGLEDFDFRIRQRQILRRRQRGGFRKSARQQSQHQHQSQCGAKRSVQLFHMNTPPVNGEKRTKLSACRAQDFSILKNSPRPRRNRIHMYAPTAATFPENEPLCKAGLLARVHPNRAFFSAFRPMNRMRFRRPYSNRVLPRFHTAFPFHRPRMHATDTLHSKLFHYTAIIKGRQDGDLLLKLNFN